MGSVLRRVLSSRLGSTSAVEVNPHPTFGMSEILQCSTGLRTIGEGATSMEEVASAVVGYLRGRFTDKATGEPALSLARLYVTQRSDELEPHLQDVARAAGTDAPLCRDLPCLTLLATVGEEPAWNDRRASVAHKAIPLPSVAALQRLPMVSRLVEQLGLDPRQVIAPDPALLNEVAARTYNVFFVPEARDSPYVPAQDSFVIPYGIRSVLGFGGVLPDGALFAVVLFSTVPVPPASVDGFAAIALSVKLALLPHVGGEVFAGRPLPRRAPQDQAELDRLLLESTNAALAQLLDLRATVVEDEVLRMECNLTEAEDRASELRASQDALRLSEALKTAVVEGSPDCVIGMDGQGRITDFNLAAEATFGYRRSEVIGEALAETLVPYNMRERHRLGLANLIATGVGPILGRRIEVNALHRNGTEFPVEVTVTRVAGSDPPLFTGYVRDITSPRQAIADLASSRERLAHIARTLQASLLPPLLPEIEGIQLAAAFQALGEGYEVGGDFYDAFELSDRRWAFSLGDVCGKGSEAAALTALARYTLRAAAMRNRDPAAVLNTLNEAINRQHPDQFCTAVYATLEPQSGKVELALGGHPHPLLLTASGVVTKVGSPSALLGPYEHWDGRTDTLTLGPGDMLVFYSDGVTEARAAKELFGEQRLEGTLAAATGLQAQGAVNLIEASVLNFAGELDDDLAILAVRRLEVPS